MVEKMEVQVLRIQITEWEGFKLQVEKVKGLRSNADIM